MPIPQHRLPETWDTPENYPPADTPEGVEKARSHLIKEVTKGRMFGPLESREMCEKVLGREVYPVPINFVDKWLEDEKGNRYADPFGRCTHDLGFTGSRDRKKPSVNGISRSNSTVLPTHKELTFLPTFLSNLIEH